MTPDFLEYVITDVHGCLAQLEEAVGRCLKHARAHQRRPRFIGLGDYIDRGPDSRGVIKLLRRLEQRYECVWLMGNHEDMLLEAMADIRAGKYETSSVRMWWSEGGKETLMSYRTDPVEGVEPSEYGRIDEDDIAWLRGLKVLVRTRHRVYVHAGLMPKVPLDEQSRHVCMWIRDRFLMVAHPKFKHLFPGVEYVVHGHTPTWGGKPHTSRVEENGFRLNLDCGTPWTGVLSVAVFQPEVPGKPLEIIRVVGEPAKKEVIWSGRVR